MRAPVDTRSGAVVTLLLGSILALPGCWNFDGGGGGGGGGGGETNCGDYQDNDGDGLIDCADPDCYSSSFCPREICNDLIDNDDDGLIDCADADCYSSSLCIREICNDLVDNDGDGLVDCADLDCTSSPLCTATCGNSICETGENAASCPQDCSTSSCVDPICDLWPQCGCSPGTKCTIDTTSFLRACLAAGSTQVGDICTTDSNCTAGTMCLWNGGPSGRCKQFCMSPSDCPGNDGYCGTISDPNFSPDGRTIAIIEHQRSPAHTGSEALADDNGNPKSWHTSQLILLEGVDPERW
jgi:hypothetical protein